MKETLVGMPSSLLELSIVDETSSLNKLDQIRIVESAEDDTNVVSFKHRFQTESV